MGGGGVDGYTRRRRTCAATPCSRARAAGLLGGPPRRAVSPDQPPLRCAPRDGGRALRRSCCSPTAPDPRAGETVEPVTHYSGEQPSFFSFFFQFRAIIFRLKGSVVPFVLPEICLGIGLSIVALYVCPDEDISTIGHQLVGVLLSFLLVFRSQARHTGEEGLLPR